MKTIQLIALFVLCGSTTFAQNHQINLDIFLPSGMITNFFQEEGKNHNAKVGYEYFLQEDKSLGFSLGFYNMKNSISGTYYGDVNSPNYGFDYTGHSNIGIANFQALIKMYSDENGWADESYWGYFISTGLLYSLETKDFGNQMSESVNFLAPMIGGGLMMGKSFLLTKYLYLQTAFGLGLGYSLNSALYMPYSDDPAWGFIANTFSFGLNTFYTLSPSFINLNLCYRF